MKTTLTALFALLSSLNPVLVSLCTGIVSLIATFNWLNARWAELIVKLDSLAASSFSGTLNVSPLGLINVFVPLQETMSLFSSWVVILATCSAIRMVKAFIPTLAS